jgi:demethylmenaquinone methyltransferase/2-methoxy-6-polyprenyl-1,4-benzoquinol methylase
MSVLPPIEEKAAYVERMFARIAPGYDRMNRIMTGGMDQGWRAFAVAAVAPPAAGRALDIGAGTGDFLIELAGWLPDGLAVGVDFTVPMMRAGLPKLARYRERAAFVGGDALCLPFPDETFDAITTGFTLRNVTDIAGAFREMWRIARPGCVMACLEVARPSNPLIRLGHRIYFERVVPLLARALGADPTAYTYLPHSARAFPQPEALAQIMQECGWSQVRYRRLGFGAVAVHIGSKPETSDRQRVSLPSQDDRL